MKRDAKKPVAAKSRKKAGDAQELPVDGSVDALWRWVTESVEPLRGKKSRVPQGGGSDFGDILDRVGKTPRPDAKREARQKAGGKPVIGHSAPTGHRQAAGSTSFKPEPLQTRTMRKLRTGRIEIEARLDLHGYRQREAHQALRRFISSSQARGHRWVMVITGKGAGGGATGGSEDALTGFDEPGVLRRNVPRWLAEPDLRPLVVGYEPAAPHHGGNGALYVHLRRKDRVR